MFLFPIVVQLPLSITPAAIRIPTPTALEVIGISGSLQALTSGSFRVDLRDQADALVGSIAWAGSGSQRVNIDRHSVPDGGELVFNVASVGLGSVGCYVTVWCRAD